MNTGLILLSVWYGKHTFRVLDPETPSDDIHNSGRVLFRQNTVDTLLLGSCGLNGNIMIYLLKMNFNTGTFRLVKKSAIYQESYMYLELTNDGPYVITVRTYPDSESLIRKT